MATPKPSELKQILAGIGDELAKASEAAGAQLEEQLQKRRKDSKSTSSPRAQTPRSNSGINSGINSAIAENEQPTQSASPAYNPLADTPDNQHTQEALSSPISRKQSNGWEKASPVIPGSDITFAEVRQYLDADHQNETSAAILAKLNGYLAILENIDHEDAENLRNDIDLEIIAVNASAAFEDTAESQLVDDIDSMFRGETQNLARESSALDGLLGDFPNEDDPDVATNAVYPQEQAPEQSNTQHPKSKESPAISAINKNAAASVLDPVAAANAALTVESDPEPKSEAVVQQNTNQASAQGPRNASNPQSPESNAAQAANIPYNDVITATYWVVASGVKNLMAPVLALLGPLVASVNRFNIVAAYNQQKQARADMGRAIETDTMDLNINHAPQHQAAAAKPDAISQAEQFLGDADDPIAQSTMPNQAQFSAIENQNLVTIPELISKVEQLAKETAELKGKIQELANKPKSLNLLSKHCNDFSERLNNLYNLQTQTEQLIAEKQTLAGGDSQQNPSHEIQYLESQINNTKTNCESSLATLQNVQGQLNNVANEAMNQAKNVIDDGATNSSSNPFVNGFQALVAGIKTATNYVTGQHARQLAEDRVMKAEAAENRYISIQYQANNINGSVIPALNQLAKSLADYEDSIKNSPVSKILGSSDTNRLAFMHSNAQSQVTAANEVNTKLKSEQRIDESPELTGGTFSNPIYDKSTLGGGGQFKAAREAMQDLNGMRAATISIDQHQNADSEDAHEDDHDNNNRPTTPAAAA